MMMPSIFGENLFDDFMDDFSFPTLPDVDKELYGKHAKNLMKTDVKETDDGYQVAVDLPGFKKDEITVNLRDGYVTISAERGMERSEKDEKTGKYVRQERYSGSCQRSFYVGEAVTPEDIKAHYDNGELKIVLPKKDAPAVETKKTIMIE